MSITQYRVFLKKIPHGILDFLLPAACATCHLPMGWVDRDHPLCAACWGQVRSIVDPYCPRCAISLHTPVALQPDRDSPEPVCLACRQHPPSFDRITAGWIYEGVLRDAIRLFKYQRRVRLGKDLTRDLIASRPPFSAADAILPVPLHPKRLRQREFNPSMVIADLVARHLARPLFPDLLRRTRETPPQVSLRREDRIQNVRSAFEMRRGMDVSGRHLILVDDVVTTGSTVSECARVLKEGGAERVDVLALARAME